MTSPDGTPLPVADRAQRLAGPAPYWPLCPREWTASRREDTDCCRGGLVQLGRRDLAGPGGPAVSLGGLDLGLGGVGLSSPRGWRPGVLSSTKTRPRLAVYRDRALDLAHYGIRKRSTAVRVLPVAGRLVMAAARLLPTQERVRYAEEFGSELWEIARVGGDRRAQLAYAARQVLAVRRLRAGLRVPRRRGAAP
jgi:hypothetical protein